MLKQPRTFRVSGKGQIDHDLVVVAATNLPPISSSFCPMPSDVIPGFVMLWKAFLLGIDQNVLSIEKPAVLAHRTDLDTYATGRNPHAVQLGSIKAQLLLSVSP